MPGTVLLLAAAPAGRGCLVDAASVLPVLAAVPPTVLSGTDTANVVELADPLEPQAVLTRLRAAAAAPAPLTVFVTGQLQLDRRQHLPHLALARTTPATVRYTGFPWHWFREELRLRAPGSTTLLLDLHADAETWEWLLANPLDSGRNTTVYGRIAPPPNRRTVSTPAYMKAVATLLRSGHRPPLDQLHQQALSRIAPDSGPGTDIILTAQGPAQLPVPGSVAGGGQGSVPVPVVGSVQGSVPAPVPSSASAFPSSAAQNLPPNPAQSAPQVSAHSPVSASVPGSVAASALSSASTSAASSASASVPSSAQASASTSVQNLPPIPAHSPAPTPAPTSVPTSAPPSPASAPAPASAPTSAPTPTPAFALSPAHSAPPSDPHADVAAALEAGRAGEADALAAHHEQVAVRSHGPYSEEALHWIEVRADLAMLAGDSVRSCRTWLTVASARLSAGQAPDTPAVESAVDRAHHQWGQIHDTAAVRELGSALAELRGRVPGRRRGALENVHQRLRQLQVSG
ncbi:hypothetical protein [Streptomyces regalis]|uniref:Uncharacterized protein n=1 Tax=Streptomyces regalis TaxID=68262 RepID=A0A0X3UP33_9ACTN|nr:hypothetical protein [Streptomyces regalis]KUL33532.1 hypothetical protein ADL12_21430 [Streptomyces regalis]